MSARWRTRLALVGVLILTAGLGAQVVGVGRLLEDVGMAAIIVGLIAVAGVLPSLWISPSENHEEPSPHR